MTAKKIFICGVLVLAVMPMFAQIPVGRLVPNGHWLYETLYDLALESGQTILSDRQPQSVGALYSYFLEIEPNRLTAYGQEEYKRVQAFFTTPNFLVKKDFFVFDTNARAAVQGQYIHNRRLEPNADSLLRYNRMPPLISVSLEMMFSPYVHVYGDFTLKKNFGAAVASYPYVNIPFSASAFEFSFPQFAGIHIGNHFFSFIIGRGPIQVGKTVLGSMLISDTVDRFDFFNAAFFMRYVRLDITVIELNPSRFMFVHAVTFRPIKQLQFRIHEAVTVHAAFDPRYLNPMMIFHNWAGWNDPHVRPADAPKTPVGTQFGVTAEYVPVSGLRIYGQFVMNQFQTAHERKLYPDEAGKIPNSLGGLFGIEYQHLVPAGRVTYSLEGMYANPWLYIMENKAISFYYQRKDNLSIGTDDVQMWIGSPYGPDTIAGIFRVEFKAVKRYRADFSYRFVAKGENGNIFFQNKKHYPENANEAVIQTPFGTPAYFHTLTLSGEYAFLANLRINARLAWTIMHGRQAGHAVEISAALCYSVR